MRRLMLAGAMVLAMVSLAGPAWSQGDSFTVEVAGVLEGDPGDVAVVAQQAVDPAFVGSTCSVTAATENNSSVHPGNALIVSSGDASGEIPGVEETPGATLELSGTVVLGEDVTISLRFGEDGITSGGVVLTFDCAQAPATTTTTTTAAPAVAPIGGVDTGAGGTADQVGLSTLTLAGMAIIVSGGLGALVWRHENRS